MDVAIDKASEDFGCDKSKIRILDYGESPSDPDTEQVRVYACGHEAAYECRYERNYDTFHTTKYHWVCSQTGHQFPV